MGRMGQTRYNESSRLGCQSQLDLYLLQATQLQDDKTQGGLTLGTAALASATTTSVPPKTEPALVSPTQPRSRMLQTRLMSVVLHPLEALFHV